MHAVMRHPRSSHDVVVLICPLLRQR
jgi:hypothetical protein